MRIVNGIYRAIQIRKEIACEKKNMRTNTQSNFYGKIKVLFVVTFFKLFCEVPCRLPASLLKTIKSL